MSVGATRRDREGVLEPAPSALELGVIKDARRRQRRRRLGIATATLAAAGAALIGGIGGGGRRARPADSTPPPQLGAGTIESPGVVFAQGPYMGVACHIPDAIGCDRVGLAVWLRRPGIVTATIAGAPLKLDDRQWSWVAHDQHGALYVYSGFLQPAGLMARLHVRADSSAWSGADAPSPSVWFRVDYGHGNIVITHENVFLSSGWG